MPLPHISSLALLVFDFDGMLTDNRVLVSQDGTEFVTCSRSDGLAFDILREAGVPTIIMSTETNPVVSQRASKLKVAVLQAVADKGTELTSYCAEHGCKNILRQRLHNTRSIDLDLAAAAACGWRL